MNFTLAQCVHRIIKITDRTLDVVFSRLRGFLFTITLRQTPKGVTRRITRHRESLFYADCFCLMVIVNLKPLNLEKTTSSVLSVILINL